MDRIMNGFAWKRDQRQVLSWIPFKFWRRSGSGSSKQSFDILAYSFKNRSRSQDSSLLRPFKSRQRQELHCSFSIFSRSRWRSRRTAHAELMFKFWKRSLNVLWTSLLMSWLLTSLKDMKMFVVRLKDFKDHTNFAGTASNLVEVRHLRGFICFHVWI